MSSFVKVGGKVFEGIFIRRMTRFTALVHFKSKNVLCFLPNPGRLHELLTPGVKVILKRPAFLKRKTCYDLIGVYCGLQLVSIDSRIPNRLVSKALKNGDIPEFSGYRKIITEYRHGNSRFDFLLSNDFAPCLLEVKSCTLVMDGVAMFPDAKTVRGTKQVLQLSKAKKEGFRACILFIVQRMDASSFTLNEKADPNFARVLREASKCGVEVYAYRSEFDGYKIALNGRINVKL
ncbi:MAG: DNA/RNA nuclease SfsA [Candidatus Bathyarchaeia archaeon]